MPRIAIIGRQNVGKSTLFNALVGRRKSIAFDMPGVTRDIIPGKVEWGDGWLLADFPGFETRKSLKDDSLSQAAVAAATEKLKDYHACIWVVHRDGMTPYERELGRSLRRTGLRFVIAVNFCDDPAGDNASGEFEREGAQAVFYVSALNRRNLISMRDYLISMFGGKPPEVPDELQTNKRRKKEIPEEPVPVVHSGIPRLSVIGKPNAGKSTFFNKLTGKELALVSEVAGTTRDAIDTEMSWHGQKFILIDTAGLRKARTSLQDVEFYSVKRTERAVAEADVVLLIIDATVGFDRQIRTILKELETALKPVIVGINKSDLLDKISREALEADLEAVRRQFWDFPAWFISASDGDKCIRLIEKALQLKERVAEKVTTSRLNALLERIKRNPILGSHRIKINYITQAAPHKRLVLFSNVEKLPGNIRRYLEGEFRKALKWEEYPVAIEVRAKHVPLEEMKRIGRENNKSKPAAGRKRPVKKQ